MDQNNRGFRRSTLAHNLPRIREAMEVRVDAGRVLEMLRFEGIPFPRSIGLRRSSPHHLELLSLFDFPLLLALSSSLYGMYSVLCTM